MSSSQRNRAEGWQHAKTSGHTNEENILELLQKDAAYREFFLKRLKKEHLEIKDINIGGLHEKQVPSILQGEKPTNAKPDLWITFSDGSSANISIKKSDSGQVYLVTGKHFLNGYEKQFKCSIPDDVKQGINLFFGQDYDSVMNFFKTNNIKPSAYEAKKRRLIHATMCKTPDSEEIALKTLEWFKENIGNITSFCFARGTAKNKCDWADYVWYKNFVGENNVDELFAIDDLIQKSIDNKNQIFYGTTRGGTTIQLPFGFLQWHFPREKKKREKVEKTGEIFKEPGSLQFHHVYDKIKQLFE